MVTGQMVKTAIGARGSEQIGQTTHFVTVEILMPNTPMGFRDGILFRLNSRLVNFMESFTSIWGT